MGQSIVLESINRQYFQQDYSRYTDLTIQHLQCKSIFNLNPQTSALVPYFSSKFCPLSRQSNLVISANEDGEVTLHNAHDGRTLACQQTHTNAVFDVCWVPDEMKFLTLSGDHTSRLWDLSSDGKMTVVSEFEGHSKSVKTADFKPNDSACFATGSRDGRVLLWDRRMRNVASKFSPEQVISYATSKTCKGKNNASDSVTGLAFQDDNYLLCCGSSNPMVYMWDLRRTYSYGNTRKDSKRKPLAVKIFEIPDITSGFSCLSLNTNRTKVYASCRNSNIYCFNLGSDLAAPVAAFTGHDNGSFYVRTCVSSDGEYLISGSSDKTVYIWRTTRAELSRVPISPMKKLSGHWAEVTGVDTSKAGPFMIASCADDSTIRLWEPCPKSGEEINREEIVERVSIMALNESVIPDLVRNTPPRSPKTVFPSHKRKNSESVTPREKRIALSPKKVNPDDGNFQSPTQNLPNYVLDGTGPSHNCSQFRQKENIDWLTRIRLKKSGDSVEDGTRKRMKLSGKKKTPKTRRTLFTYYKKSSKTNDEVK